MIKIFHFIAKTETKVKTKKEAGIRDLFQPSQMKYRTLNMFYQWCAVTLAYYGLTFSSTDLAGDPYANFCSGVGIEIPGTYTFQDILYWQNCVVKSMILNQTFQTISYRILVLSICNGFLGPKANPSIFPNGCWY